MMLSIVSSIAAHDALIRENKANSGRVGFVAREDGDLPRGPGVILLRPNPREDLCPLHYEEQSSC